VRLFRSKIIVIVFSKSPQESEFANVEEGFV
jgi:hypothetical protein